MTGSETLSVDRLTTDTSSDNHSLYDVETIATVIAARWQRATFSLWHLDAEPCGSRSSVAIDDGDVSRTRILPGLGPPPRAPGRVDADTDSSTKSRSHRGSLSQWCLSKMERQSKEAKHRQRCTHQGPHRLIVLSR
jgi:hypothetical protein